MKKTIHLNERDISRMVMETVSRLNEMYGAKYIEPDGEFDYDGAGLNLNKKEQEDSAWDLYNDQRYIQTDKPEIGHVKYSTNCPFDRTSGMYDTDENFRDNGLKGHYSLLAQGYNNLTGQEASPSDIAFGQEHRGSSNASVEAGKHNWLGGGLPHEEEFNDDGPLPILGMVSNDNGKVDTRSSINGEYSPYSGLSESIKRNTSKAIKQMLRCK